jgi:menaquinone-dependent protoporphyrinogen oxidase
MKTLVLYASKYGMTEKLANIMVRHRTNVHLESIDEFTNSLADYDEVILGTPIYAGMINKKLKKFIEMNKNTLLEKQVKVFLCGMSPENEDQVIEQNFDPEIQSRSTIKYCGGAFQFKKMNFFFKMIVKKMAKTDQDQEVILHENINYLLSN